MNTLISFFLILYAINRSKRDEFRWFEKKKRRNEWRMSGFYEKRIMFLSPFLLLLVFLFQKESANSFFPNALYTLSINRKENNSTMNFFESIPFFFNKIHTNVATIKTLALLVEALPSERIISCLLLVRKKKKGNQN